MIVHDISINFAPAFGGFKDVKEKNSQCHLKPVTRGENVALRQGWLAQSGQKHTKKKNIRTGLATT